MIIRCIDTETTGLNPAIHRVCEVATVDVVADHTKVEAGDLIRDHGDGNYDHKAVPIITRGCMWSSLVNPEMTIPPEASAIHDITDEMVKDAHTLATVTDDIMDHGMPDYWCAHNSRFDSKFINLSGTWLDTYRIALWLWPSAPEHKLHTLRYWLNLKLATPTDPPFMKQVAPDIIRSHRALWDAYVCAAVLRRAFMTGVTIEQMVEVSSQPALLPRLTFGKWAMKPVETIDAGYLDWILGQRDMDEDVRHTAFAELQRRRRLEKLEASQ